MYGTYSTLKLAYGLLFMEESIGSGLVYKKVSKVIQYAEENGGKAMEGYKGGRTFKNTEGLLPKTDATGAPIKYKEYDINPYKKDVDRGAERVVSGSDGKYYYTNDHYKSFTVIKN